MTDSVDIFWHPDCFKHDTSEGCYEYGPSPLMVVNEIHPENAQRLLNVKSILEKGPIKDQLTWQQGQHASVDAIKEFHTKQYIDSITSAELASAEKNVPTRIDGAGTIVNIGSMDAALAAAGCGLDALTTILNGGKRAYALVRPPGHHAQPTMGDGSCIFNNVGVVAHAALKSGIKRVAVIDWDVHHGNGTQEGFYDRDDVLTFSMHMPLGVWGKNHPQTGEVDEVGSGNGVGYNVNIPLPYGAGDKAYQAVMEEIVIPKIDAYKPELIIIACGQDANQFDNNGRNLLSMKGFRALGRMVRDLADKHCDGQLLMMQEGGYAITYTAFCMYAIMEGVLKVKDVMADPMAYDSSIEKPEVTLKVILELNKAWQAAVDAAK